MDFVAYLNSRVYVFGLEVPVIKSLAKVMHLERAICMDLIGHTLNHLSHFDEFFKVTQEHRITGAASACCG